MDGSWFLKEKCCSRRQLSNYWVKGKHSCNPLSWHGAGGVQVTWWWKANLSACRLVCSMQSNRAVLCSWEMQIFVQTQQLFQICMVTTQEHAYGFDLNIPTNKPSPLGFKTAFPHLAAEWALLATTTPGKKPPPFSTPLDQLSTLSKGMLSISGESREHILEPGALIKRQDVSVIRVQHLTLVLASSLEVILVSETGVKYRPDCLYLDI